MVSPVLVVLDLAPERIRFVDPDEPVVRADEIGYLRGDGVFETISVIDGRTHGLAEHLARLRASADAIGLRVPRPEMWGTAVAEAITAHDPRPELTVRLSAAYGTGSDDVRCLVRVEATADNRLLRANGISVVVLDRGYARGATDEAPWLLAGVKSTSGAITRAALREARRHDAEDVIWRSSDGWLLEGATSSLLVLSEGVLSTPHGEAGILDGTTVTRLLDIGVASGLRSARTWLREPDLIAADAAWLVSSTRRAIPIRHVDGVPLPIDHDLTEAFERELIRPPR
ncbi:aminotransferase class IV [Microbacteriaceae bacterium VKM Ac-2855]|nr:aminotransferase class IV [Microbacteriaceae bacterium VKM Ac-2855]